MKALKGKVIAITRNEKDAKEFFGLVRAEDGRPIALPTIEIVPEPGGKARLFIDRLAENKHDFCAFLSAQSAEVLFGMADSKEIIKALGHTRIIAIGPKTRESLEELGVKVSLMPSRFSSEGIVELLSGLNPAGKKIIIPRSAAANELVARALTSLGMQVDEIVLYSPRTCSPSHGWKEFVEMLAMGRIDAVILTSASNVESFFKILTGIAPERIDLNKLTKIISIGPATSKELRGRGLQYVEAQDHTVNGTFELAKTMLSKHPA